MSFRPLEVLFKSQAEMFGFIFCTKKNYPILFNKLYLKNGIYQFIKNNFIPNNRGQPK